MKINKNILLELLQTHPNKQTKDHTQENKLPVDLIIRHRLLYFIISKLCVGMCSKEDTPDQELYHHRWTKSPESDIIGQSTYASFFNIWYYIDVKVIFVIMVWIRNEHRELTESVSESLFLFFVQ